MQEAEPLPEHRTYRDKKRLGNRRTPGTYARTAAISLLVSIVVTTPNGGQAQNESSKVRPDLEAIEREQRELEARGEALRAEAEKLAAEAASVQRRLVKTAAELRRREAAIEELETRLADIRAEEKDRAAGLATRRARLKQLLAALERIARHPPEAMMAYTGSPQDTLRGAMLLRTAIPELEAEARELRESLRALAELGEEATMRAAALKEQRTVLEDKKEQLASLVARKKGLARATEKELKAAERRQARLAEKAKTLQELLRNIEREKAAAERGRREVSRAPEPRQQARVRLRPPVRRDLPASIAKARGNLVRPVLGEVAVGFGDDSGAAGTAKGASFAAPAGSRVLAPFGGEVVFSGPFRGYGLLLIIDHGEGYHSLLAGLGRIDASVGQRILAGEPVGVMARAAGDLPRLYMELRKSSRPIDPLPWLAAPSSTQAKSKVSG